MSKGLRSVPLLALAILVTSGSIAPACTSIVVSRGASRDGSVMVTYSADAPFMPKLLYLPGGTHQAGELIQVRAWENDQLVGPVKQVSQTYSVVGLMNEHQLSLGETTTGGRRELRDPKGMLDYDALMLLTLQRAKTAREAIKVVDELAREYGYQSSGETFSIADSEGSLDHGADWQRTRSERDRVGCGPRPGRDDHGTCQYEPDYHIPTQ